VPSRSATDEAVRLAHELWSLLGGIPEITTAPEHDRLLALTSHLPHVLASAMARVLALNGIPRPELGPGGRDMTRLAGSSPEIWSAISADNAPFIGHAVDVLREELDRFAAALRGTDAAELLRFFDVGRTWFEEDLPTGIGPQGTEVSSIRQTS
ncbi:MAG: prephenate dehydrogenase dimerization domain-containing protein, partial [Thermoanaerobaculia bacterium]